MSDMDVRAQDESTQAPVPEKKTRTRKASRKSNDAAETRAQRAERIFKQSQQLHHDLYILSPEAMIKDTSIGKVGDSQFFVPVQHQHFFHTIDSNGKPMKECGQIGGHFHEMEVIPGKDGEPPQVKCVSGPMIWAREKRGDKFVRVKRPANSYDTHTHETTYLQSEIVTPRKANAEAAKVQGAVHARQTAQHIKAPTGQGSIVEGS